MQSPEERKLKMKEWRLNHKAHLNLYWKMNRASIKFEVLSHYGPCSCGERRRRNK